MGADVIARGRYECSHGCMIGGHCPGHDFAVWYREGFCYIALGKQNYRDALCVDANLLEAVTAAMKDRDG